MNSRALAQAAAHLTSGLATLEGPELRYGFVNAAMQQLVGADILGKRIEEHPGQLPAALLQGLRPALASGQPHVVAGWLLAGAAGAAGQYVDLRLEPYRQQAAGPVAGLLLLALAVPAPVAEALALRTLQSLANSLPELAWLASPEGLAEHYNSSTMRYAGLSAQELGPTGWVGLLHPAEQPLAVAQWQQGVRVGATFAGQYRVRRQDGAYRWHLLRARPLNDDLQVRWFVTMTDVEEQHHLRQGLFAQYRELAQLHQRLEAVAYATNHDLRQPALNLRGLFEELRQVATFSDHEQAHMLRLLDHSLHELDTSFHHLLELAQAAAPEPVEEIVLLPLLEEVLAGLRSLVVRHTTEVELLVAADCRLRGHRASLLAIGYNLLSNALQFVHPDRPARVVVRGQRLAGGQVVLQVQDNGRGLDPATPAAAVFHLFQRPPAAGAGAGVGLYLVKRLVEAAGGTITAESVPDQGTTFTLTLLEQ